MTDTQFTPVIGTGHDKPDSRDISYEELYELGAGEEGSYSLDELPEKVSNDITPPLNQGSRGACSMFGSSMAYFEYFAQKTKPLAYKQPFDVWQAWDEAIKKGASDTNGWYVQSALQHLTDTKRIGGYARIGFPRITDFSIYKICKAISEGHGVVIGFSHADWSYVVNTGKFREQSAFSGHLMETQTYDTKKQFDNGDVGGLWIPNSWGGRGGFWISFEQLKKARTYTQYITVLTKYAEKLANVKKKRKNIYLQKAFDKGIWNEERPDKLATTVEVQIMVNRAFGLPENYKWQRGAVASMIDEYITRGKIKIYNEENKYQQASHYEFAIMLTRGVMRNSGVSELALSREQVAEVIGRDFL